MSINNTLINQSSLLGNQKDSTEVVSSGRPGIMGMFHNMLQAGIQSALPPSLRTPSVTAKPATPTFSFGTSKPKPVASSLSKGLLSLSKGVLSVAPSQNTANASYSGVVPPPMTSSPLTSSSSSQSPMYTPSGMLITGNPGTWSGNETQGNPQQPNPQQSTLQFQQPVKGLFGNIAESLANRSVQGSPQANEAIQATQKSAQGAYDTGSTSYQASLQQAAAYNKALQESRVNEAHGLADNAMNPIPLEFQQGRGQIIQSQYAQEQAALGSAYQGASALAGYGIQGQGQGITGLGAAAGAANTAQQNTLTGLNNAGSLTQPVSQFGQITDPTTGQVIGAGQSGNNPQLENAVSNAVRLVQNGADQSQALASISGYGQAGINAFNQAMQQATGGIYNPSAQSTQVQTNQANLASTQTQAFSVNQALQQVSQVEPLITNFLTKSGVNPYDAQEYNGPVKDYLSKVGASGQVAQWGSIMGELKNYTSQLIASGYGGTPTGAEAATLAQDPSNLSYSQIQAYLGTLKDLGSNRLNVLQGNILSLGGNATGYSGAPATSVNSTTPAPMGQTGFGVGITDPAKQFGAGLATDIVPEAANAAVQGGVFSAGKELFSLLFK